MSPFTKRCRGWSRTSRRFSIRPAYVSLSSVVTCQSGCVSIAYRTKFDPMKPAPPVTSTLTIFSHPIVGKRAVRLDTVLVRILVAIRFGRDIHDKRRVSADALPAVIHEVGHADQ